MRHITLLLILFLSSQLSSAQINEFGVFIGGSNFIGDVGATNYIAPKQLAIGALYKWNRSTRHSYRISLTYTELEGIDNDSDDPSRQVRGYEFNNSIIELSAGMEFTFFDFDLHDGGNVSTPYLYSGITVAKHDNFYFNPTNGNIVDENTSSYAFGIPMVLGYKAAVSPEFIIALEIGARYTFSDELDGSVPDFGGADSPVSFGNVNNNDWYTFTGITITYTFGRNPCFCPGK
ncbi:type IX secretion system protein PorG [Lacinutrix chionoecetis]